MKNKLISIGWLGFKTCYLNVSREEAIRRYIKSEGATVVPLSKAQLEKDNLIKEFEFEDEFFAYDVGKPG